MARSLTAVGSTASAPNGHFKHDYSKTEFTIHSDASGTTQTLIRQDETIEKAVAFVIGSGNHARGYLVKNGNSVFQSPLSYYTKRNLWGIAPGYELDRHPDFSRPITAECLFCHAGKALPIADSLNRYQPGVFSEYSISCERCHGEAEAHLKNPLPGSILNPAKLHGAVRASICEQCHLAGEVRIPNPGKSITDFAAGKTLEDFYTTYVAEQPASQRVKVVSQAEQLALSACAKNSGGKMWCGTCHNPHDKPDQVAAYFRERCLTCHAGKLDHAHAQPGRNCVGCHMPQVPATDGGHTAFTNHRIARPADIVQTASEAVELKAWREPDQPLRERNLALALVVHGLQNQDSTETIRGYRSLNRLERDFSTDPAVLTSLGSILMKGKQPAEALKRFQRAVQTKPGYGPYYVNLAFALLAVNRPSEAESELQKAITLDPLLQSAVWLLVNTYREQGDVEKAKNILSRYNEEMGISVR